MDEKEKIMEFVALMDKNIDNLNHINGKLDYTTDYEQGYDDAAHAIKNTMHTLAKKMFS